MCGDDNTFVCVAVSEKFDCDKDVASGLNSAKCSVGSTLMQHCIYWPGVCAGCEAAVDTV